MVYRITFALAVAALLVGCVVAPTEFELQQPYTLRVWFNHICPHCVQQMTDLRGAYAEIIERYHGQVMVEGYVVREEQLAAAQLAWYPVPIYWRADMPDMIGVPYLQFVDANGLVFGTLVGYTEIGYIYALLDSVVQ